MRAATDTAGFTLMEMLVTVLVTAILVTGVGSMYIQLTSASERATGLTRDARGAAAILDRLARDLEGAFLIRKPAELDPLSHPWLFLAEARGGDALGANHVKFNTLGHSTRASDGHRSDVATMAYFVDGDADAGYALLRWVENGRPQELDRRFPNPEDPGVAVLTEDLASLSLRFLSETGGWTTDWDSSLLVDSGELPVAVEISVSLLPPVTDPDAPLDFEETPLVYTRTVVLPQRPLEFSTLAGLGLRGFGAGEDLDGNGIPDDQEDPDRCEIMTIGECMALQDPAAMQALDPSIRNGFEVLRSACFLAIDAQKIQLPDTSRCLR